MSTLKSAIENTVASLVSMQAENTQMNGVTVDAKGGDDVVIAKGDNNDINVGKDNDIVFVSGENNTVKGADGDKTTVVKGKNNDVEYNGDGNYATEIDGQNIKFKGGNGSSAVSIKGSNNKYEVGDGELQYISVNGKNNDVKTGDASQRRVNVSGSSNKIDSGDGATDAKIDGSSNKIKIGEGAASLQIDGDSNTFEKGDGDITAVIKGNSNSVKSGEGAASLNIDGNSNNFKKGDGDITAIINGSSNAVKSGEGAGYLEVTGSSNKFEKGDGDITAIVEGNSNSVKSGDGAVYAKITGSSNLAEFGDGDKTLYLTGDSNTLKAGDGKTYAEINGNSNNIEMGDGDRTVKMVGNSNNMTVGDGDSYVTVQGNSNNLKFGDGNNTIGFIGDRNRVECGDGNNYIAFWGDSNYIKAGNGDNYVTSLDLALKQGNFTELYDAWVKTLPVNYWSKSHTYSVADDPVITKTWQKTKGSMFENKRYYTYYEGEQRVRTYRVTDKYKTTSVNGPTNSTIILGSGKNTVAVTGGAKVQAGAQTTVKNCPKWGWTDYLGRTTKCVKDETNTFTGRHLDKKGYWYKDGLIDIGAIVVGAVVTWLSAGTLGPVMAGVIGGVSAGVTSSVGKPLANGEKIDMKNVAVSAAGGAAGGLVGGATAVGVGSLLGTTATTTAATAATTATTTAATTAGATAGVTAGVTAGAAAGAAAGVAAGGVTGATIATTALQTISAIWTGTAAGSLASQAVEGGHVSWSKARDAATDSLSNIDTYASMAIGAGITGALNSKQQGFWGKTGDAIYTAANTLTFGGLDTAVGTYKNTEGSWLKKAGAAALSVVDSATGNLAHIVPNIGNYSQRYDAYKEAGNNWLTSGTKAIFGDTILENPTSLVSNTAYGVGKLAVDTVKLVGKGVSALGNGIVSLGKGIGKLFSSDNKNSTGTDISKQSDILTEAEKIRTQLREDVHKNYQEYTDFIHDDNNLLEGTTDMMSDENRNKAQNLSDKWKQSVADYKKLLQAEKALQTAQETYEADPSDANRTEYVRARANYTDVITDLTNRGVISNQTQATAETTAKADPYTVRDSAKAELGICEKVLEMAQEDLRTAQRDLTKAKDAYNEAPNDAAKKQAYQEALKTVKQAQSFVELSQQNLETAQTNWENARTAANDQTWYGKISNGIESGINYLNNTFEGSVFALPVKAATTALSVPGEIVRFATDNKYGWGSDLKYTAQNMFTKENCYGLKALYEYSGLKNVAELANNTVGLITGKKLALDNTAIGEKWNTVIDSDYSIGKGLQWIAERFSPSTTTKDALTSAKTRVDYEKAQLKQAKEFYNDYKKESLISQNALNNLRANVVDLQSRYDAAVRNYRQYTALGQISTAVNDGINGLLSSTKGTVYSPVARLLANSLNFPGQVLKFATNNGYGWGKDLKYTANNLFRGNNFANALYEWSGAKATVETLNNTAGLLLGSKLALSSAKNGQTWSTVVDADSIWNKIGRTYDKITSYFKTDKATTPTKKATKTATKAAKTTVTKTATKAAKTTPKTTAKTTSAAKATQTQKTATVTNPLYTGITSAITQNLNSLNYDNVISRINPNKINLSRFQTV